MRRLITTLFAAVLCMGIWAQTSLRGVVVADDSGEPIRGAKVTLANQNISTTTNVSGEFALLYLEAMDEEIILEANGYVSDIVLALIEDGKSNDLGTIRLQPDVQKEMKDEVLLALADEDLNDDEGKTQSMASGTSASVDVFNNTSSYAWSTARYRGRGYESYREQTYINGISFNSQERGVFNYSSMGGLNDASRNKEVVNAIEANNFTFGDLGQSTNILMDATRYAQGWKVGIGATNRNYKGVVRASYNSGLLQNGWAFMAQLAWRYSPALNIKGIIGEGSDYNSFGYFFSAEKRWGSNHRLSLITFGSPSMRGQNSALTQETVDLTGSIYYNPYWGYQNGKVRNSREVKSFDPTVIISYDWKVTDKQTFKAAVGAHYNLYSNSALSFYNAPDPRPDYYRNMPSFLLDGQTNSDGTFIAKDLNGKDLGVGFNYNGTYMGGSIDKNAYTTLTDLWTSRDNRTTQIDWDALYAANYANNVINPNGSARYIVERRHNDIIESMANINYANSEYDHLKITAGLELKESLGIHYKTMDDLLGGKQWIDVDPFAERDIKDLATNVDMTQKDIENVKQNDLNRKNAAIKDGDKFGYDYRINMTKVNLWAQNEWKFSQVDFYYGLKVTASTMNRTSSMLNGRAWYLAQINPDQAYYYLGKDYKRILDTQRGSIRGYNHFFIDPAIKAGVTYKIDGHNQLKVNALAQTSAPLARDAYISSRVHDRVVANIYQHDRAKSLKDFYASDEKMVSADLTYEFNYPIIRGRITGYFSQFWNGTELNGYYDDEARTFVNQALTGIDRRHMGIEAAAAIKLGKYFTLTPIVAYGSYKYTSNAFSVTSAENGMSLAEDAPNKFELGDSVMIKGLHVAAGPQLNASLKLSFFHPKMWFADITVSYFDKSYLDYAPSRRMKGLYTGTRADGSVVNGSYANVAVASGTGKVCYTTASAVNTNENGDIVWNSSTQSGLVYPYNKLDQQESLVAQNPWHRFLIDVSFGKLIYLKNRQSISINLTVNNITNNTHFKTGGYQQARLPRQTVQGESVAQNKHVAKSLIASNVWKYPAKYYYAWGTNFYLTATYKF